MSPSHASRSVSILPVQVYDVQATHKKNEYLARQKKEQVHTPGFRVHLSMP